MIPDAKQRVAEKRVRLNPQGLARKDKPLMSAIQPDAGHVFVSCDLSSGEPTCTSHYSQDKNYYDCTFGMVGKEPFYSPANILKIDNIYMSVMSVSPMGKTIIRDLFHSTYDGARFDERWLEPDFQDRIKAQIKKEYAFHKIGTLGMSYGMGPRKFQATAYDAGYLITFGQAKEFFNAYWQLFAGVREFADKCAAGFKLRGYLVNDFGYRLLPDAPYKAFNYYIQSSVSGIMHVIAAQFFARAPYCRFLLVIHDEVIFSCPRERVEAARTAMKQTEEALNKMLGWRVNVRIGFKAGESLYDAK
jgi:hypothetical protein